MRLRILSGLLNLIHEGLDQSWSIRHGQAGIRPTYERLWIELYVLDAGKFTECKPVGSRPMAGVAERYKRVTLLEAALDSKAMGSL